MVYVDPFGLETKVYVEEGGSSDGALSIMGHAYLEISRDGDSTVYSWSPGEGYQFNQSDDDYLGPDLDVSTIDTYLSRHGKDDDTYHVYTFDTTVEQESSISAYYMDLGDKNLNNTVAFNPLTYNCVDVLTGALQSGGIVSDSFKATSMLLSTPGNLKSQFDHKISAQNASNRFTRWWHNSKAPGVIMGIKSSETMNTAK